jgi:hypothetical protein
MSKKANQYIIGEENLYHRPIFCLTWVSIRKFIKMEKVSLKIGIIFLREVILKSALNNFSGTTSQNFYTAETNYFHLILYEPIVSDSHNNLISIIASITDTFLTFQLRFQLFRYFNISHYFCDTHGGWHVYLGSYLSICLSVSFSLAIPVAATWSIGNPWNACFTWVP